jgi:hypothetical protein
VSVSLVQLSEKLAHQGVVKFNEAKVASESNVLDFKALEVLKGDISKGHRARA